MLSLNHNAKGLVMWLYPTNLWHMDATSDLSGDTGGNGVFVKSSNHGLDNEGPRRIDVVG